MSNLKLSIGTSAFVGAELQKKALQAVKAAGIKEVDSAQMYGNNEADIGEADVSGLGLIFSTKNRGGWNPGEALKPDVLYQSAHDSLKRLNLKQVDIFYIHGPDRTETGKPENWVPTIDKLHKEGVFRRFGISNFSPEETRTLYNYSKANGLILPTVYQGNYNAVSRTIEQTLFPVLRELNIVFYAYSPVAGGYLTKSKAQILDGKDAGRFSDNKSGLNEMYRKIYFRESFLHALDTWQELAEAEGIPKAELAYRWVYYHSALKPELGDVVILGASKIEQIGSSVEGLKHGPLKAETAKAIDDLWDSIKHDAKFVDNFDSTQ
jgi:aflatoxin B1 aldehyde reductase